MSMGYDKNFIGDGIRSLFLSDFSANSTFVKLNTRIWKLNYENIYSEIMPPYVRGADRQLPVKYSTTHYLSINATKWLNLGLFENVIFQRADHYSFGYMNPIIFFRALEEIMVALITLIWALVPKLLLPKAYKYMVNYF